MTLQELRQFTFQTFRPPKAQTVSEWADENRVLVSESSSTPGPWRTDHAPYQREIMDAFTQSGVWKIVIMASAQVGKTELELNMMGRAIDVDPGPMLFIVPKVDFAEDFSKRRVAPMIQACPALRRKVFEAKSRATGNTIAMKQFPGGSVTFVGANSPTDLAGRPVRYEFMDETDRFPDSAGTEGDPKKLAEKRTETYRQNRKIVESSTPTIKGKSKIERAYEEGTQEEWHTECPHCQKYSFIRWQDIQYEKHEYDQNGKKGYSVESIAWRCPVCKRESSEFEMKRAPAKWVARHPKALEEGIRSFRLNAFMSPWSDWKAIVRDYLDAGNDPELLQVFWNTVLGETWELRDYSGGPEKLYQRRENYNAEVPTGVHVLTMGIDTQDNRLEYEVVGWSRDEESWGISRGVIPGRADAPGVWAEVDELLDREWKMANGMAMRILATFVDSGGHFTDEVYEACAKRAHKRIWPIKGKGGESVPYVRLMKSMAGKKDAVGFLIGVDSGKEAIMHASTIESAGLKYMHFPKDYRLGYDMEFFKGLLSERMVIHRSKGKNTIGWEKTYDRNEPLDCRNYARAAFKYFNWNFDKIIEAQEGRDEVKPVTKAQAEKKKPRRVISSGIKV